MRKANTINYTVPGYRTPWRIDHLIFDLNGTLTIDGKLIIGVDDGIKELRDRFSDLKMYLFTGDTQGTGADIAQELDLDLRITKSGKAKKDEAIKMGSKEHRAAIGNGAIDAELFHEVRLGMAVIQQEGASMETMRAARMVFTSINDAIRFLLDEKRFVAGLRQ